MSTYATCCNCGAPIRRLGASMVHPWVSDDGNHDLCPANLETFDHEPTDWSTIT